MPSPWYYPPKLSIKNITISTIVGGFLLMLWNIWSYARVQWLEQHKWSVERANPAQCHPLNVTEEVGAGIFPHQDPTSDRIVAQMNYVPKNYDYIQSIGRMKSIALHEKHWQFPNGENVFESCRVNTCEIIPFEYYRQADLVAYKKYEIPEKSINRRQIVMQYTNESPVYNYCSFAGVNWTATYRPDSDIVVPYGKWVYHDPNVRQLSPMRNYALNKTKKVAMFVSHCPTTNNRLHYAHRLNRHIQVDIYGNCGSLTCAPLDTAACFKMLDADYKFYLAFENSNCLYYITEKLFVNAFHNNVLPIVMGARREDYEAVAPYHSFIHVDDFETPKDLAAYLHVLDGNDELYNSYFKWMATGEFIDTKLWCRICAALHDPSAYSQPHCYGTDWWEKGTCIKGSWTGRN